MPTKSRCFNAVRGEAMRVTQVDACGRPVYGEDTSVVTDGFVTINFTANVEDGEEINVTKANGKRCVYEPACPTLLGYELEIEFCEVDPALFAMLTGQEAIIEPTTGDVIGFKVCSDADACGQGFAIEVWTGTAGQTACDESQGSESQPGGYFLVPFMQGGTFGDFTIENDAVTFTVQGAASKDGSAWGAGPHAVEWDAANQVYGPLVSTTVTSCDHFIVMQTTAAPPTPYCGPIPTLDPNDPAVTGLTTAPGSADNAVLFSPDPEGDAPFWVDFGDGEWDYSEDGTALEHQYELPGTYTVTIYRGSTSYTPEEGVTVEFAVS